MNRRKHKKARLLTMDELHARPCEVDGRPAIFHRWIEEDREILRFDAFFSLDRRMDVRRKFNSCGAVPTGCRVDVLRKTVALVEYRDGTIAKVLPELIRFTKAKEETET